MTLIKVTIMTLGSSLLNLPQDLKSPEPGQQLQPEVESQPRSSTLKKPPTSQGAVDHLWSLLSNGWFPYLFNVDSSGLTEQNLGRAHSVNRILKTLQLMRALGMMSVRLTWWDHFLDRRPITCISQEYERLTCAYLQHLMKELEDEREKRWKSEMAAKKLAEQVQALRAQGQESSRSFSSCMSPNLGNNVKFLTASEEKELQTVAVDATSRLKQILAQEREEKMRLQAELEVMQVGFPVLAKIVFLHPSIWSLFYHWSSLGILHHDQNLILDSRFWKYVWFC